VPAGTPTTTAPTVPTTPPPATATPRPPSSGGLTAWPAGRAGFTVVLESIPTTAGRAFAVARARSRASIPATTSSSAASTPARRRPIRDD
jgi:hypothetical protein